MAKKTKKHSDPKQEIITSAINLGVGEVIRLHPRFVNSGYYILSHINSDNLSKMFDELYTFAQKNEVPKERIGEYITKGLANYIASGKALDDSGKERILRNGLEEKATRGLFGRGSARRELEGDRYLDQVIGAWNKINELAKEGGSELPEEMTRPMQYLSRLGFAIPATEILEENGLIDKSQYSQIKENIRKGAYESHNEGLKRLEEYSKYQKVAALILGVIGVSLLLASGLNLTGGVIGTAVGKNILLSLIGTVSFLASLVLLIKKR